MAKMHTPHAGTATYQKVFATLPCPIDGEPTQHSQRWVIAHWPESRQAKWCIVVRCSKCKLEHVWQTNEVPEGLQLYHVRVYAQGRTIPELGVEVPTLEEEFKLLATSRQAAYQQSQFSRTMPTMGQIVETYIDGEVEHDERY